jgi:hypothetical protein
MSEKIPKTCQKVRLMSFRTVETFHHTRNGYIVFGLVELALSYLFGSLAINSGSLWQWALAIIFFIGFLQNSGRLIVLLAARKKRKANQWP